MGGRQAHHVPRVRSYGGRKRSCSGNHQRDDTGAGGSAEAAAARTSPSIRSRRRSRSSWPRIMSSQLLLFDLPEPTPLPKAVTPPEPEPEAKAFSFGAFQVVAYENTYYRETHYAVWHGNTRIGWFFLVGGTTYSLHFPNEHGCCGFGGPNLKGAAKELLKCWKEQGRTPKL